MDNPQAAVLSECLGEAIENVLMKGKSPTPVLHTIDNRGSHFYLAMYWAQHLASQSKDLELAESFASLAEELDQCRIGYYFRSKWHPRVTDDLERILFPCR